MGRNTIPYSELKTEDERLIRIYMMGFDDELWGEPKTHFDETLYNSAYLLGRNHAIIGDEVSSIDNLTEKEILVLIKE